MFSNARDEAKLLPSDLAKLLDVNRCTVSFWFNDRSKPHVQLQAKVNKCLDAVSKAFDVGDLPVPHDVSRRERAHYIQQVILKQLRAAAAQVQDQAA